MTRGKRCDEQHSPWAQVVQAVLGFHVDQWDPGTDADRERERDIKLLCIVDNISSLFKLNHKTAKSLAGIGN